MHTVGCTTGRADTARAPSPRNHEGMVSASLTPEAVPATVRIEAARGWFSLNLREVWAYRELLYFLVWRDVKVRYKQTVVGVAWVILQPLVTTAIFAVIFGRFAGLPSEGVPYTVFVFAALVPWQQFSGALSRAASSLVVSSNLLTKVYFPRLIVPMAAAVVGVVDLAVSLAILAGLMVWYGITPSWAVLLVPVLAALALFVAFAIGLWLSALNVKYRDVQQVVPFLIQAWMFASPVAYSAGIIPAGKWRLLYELNPLVGVIQGFRWALFGTPLPGKMTLVSLGLVALVLIGGLIYFKRTEDTFADVV